MTNLEEHSSTSRLDLAFAHFLSKRSQTKRKQLGELENVLTQLSFEQSQGHSCLFITDVTKALLLQSGFAA